MGSGRLKVAYVIDRILEPTGGTEIQLLRLLENIDRDRFDPMLYCLKSSDWLVNEYDPTRWNHLGIKVGPRPRLPFQINGFANQLRTAGTDIVQTYFQDGNTVGVLAASRAGVKTIISTRRGVPYWASGIGPWVLQQLNRRATLFLANSEATKNRCVRDEHLDPSRIDVIHNGLVPDDYCGLEAGSRRELRKQIGLPADCTIIGIVANLRAVKGIDDFVRAAHSVHETHPQVHFALVGQGPLEAPLRERCRELGIEDHVHFVGVRRDVPHILQCLDIGVLCSHFESFSNSALEYVAAGLPVVVTDVGGVRELVRDGHQGIVVPPKSPERLAKGLVTILNHPGGPSAWPGAGDLDPRFSLPQMIRAHEELYLRLADVDS